jgi:hypothetical protein
VRRSGKSSACNRLLLSELVPALCTSTSSHKLLQWNPIILYSTQLWREAHTIWVSAFQVIILQLRHRFSSHGEWFIRVSCRCIPSQIPKITGIRHLSRYLATWFEAAKSYLHRRNCIREGNLSRPTIGTQKSHFRNTPPALSVAWPSKSRSPTTSF